MHSYCVVMDDTDAGPAKAVPQEPTDHLLTLDSRALQVLAHPLRSRLLSALRSEGPATATALAAALETNTGATSYHLRKLAAVGLVRETGEGRGRERWWRAATEMHHWTERDVADDPDGRAATDWLRRHYLQSFMERYGAWLDAQPSWPLDWQDAAGSSDYIVRLSAPRLRELQDEVLAVFERYRDPEPEDTAAERVGLYIHAFPLDLRRSP